MNLRPTVDQQGGLQEEISCPACKGEGGVEVAQDRVVRCGYCKGQGVVYVDELSD